MSGSRPASDRQQHPDGAGYRRGPAEPDPGGVAHHRERRGGNEQQIEEQAGQRRVVGLHQGRGDEGAEDADGGDQLAVAQRQRQADQRRCRQQDEAGQGRHQRIQHAGAIGGAEQHRDTAGGECWRRLIGHARTADLPAGAATRRRRSARRRAIAARTQRVGRAEQALIHRVADQEDAGEHQRGGAEPDAPARRQQRLDVGRGVPWRPARLPAAARRPVRWGVLVLAGCFVPGRCERTATRAVGGAVLDMSAGGWCCLQRAAERGNLARAESALKNAMTPRIEPPSSASTSRTPKTTKSSMPGAPIQRLAGSMQHANQNAGPAARYLSLLLNRLSGILSESQPPGAGESGHAPRRRRRNRPPETLRQKDRGGIRDLWKAGGRVTRCRTDGVRGAAGALNLSGSATEGGQRRRHRSPADDPCGADQ